MCAQSLSRVLLSATQWTVAHQLPCPWDFPGKNTGVGCHFPPPGDLPNLGIKPESHGQADSLPFLAPGKKPNLIPYIKSHLA